MWPSMSFTMVKRACRYHYWFQEFRILNFNVSQTKFYHFLNFPHKKGVISKVSQSEHQSLNSKVCARGCTSSIRFLTTMLEQYNYGAGGSRWHGPWRHQTLQAEFKNPSKPWPQSVLYTLRKGMNCSKNGDTELVLNKSRL